MKLLLAFAAGMITGVILVLTIIIGLTVEAINKQEDEELKEEYYGPVDGCG